MPLILRVSQGLLLLGAGNSPTTAKFLAVFTCGTIQQSDYLVLKVFKEGPFPWSSSPVSPVNRRDADGVVVRKDGLRGIRGKARGHSGAREGTEKLEPNQHGVELLRPNLQVTPRGSGGGGSGSDQSRQLLRAPPGGEEASLANRHRHRSAELGGPGPWGEVGEPGRGVFVGLRWPPETVQAGPGAPESAPALSAVVSYPAAWEHWRCAWLRRPRQEPRVAAACAVCRRGTGGGGGRARGSGCGRGARCSPCSLACFCCCACSRAQPTRLLAPGNRPAALRGPRVPRTPPNCPPCALLCAPGAPASDPLDLGSAHFWLMRGQGAAVAGGWGGMGESRRQVWVSVFGGVDTRGTTLGPLGHWLGWREMGLCCEGPNVPRSERGEDLPSGSASVSWGLSIPVRAFLSFPLRASSDAGAREPPTPPPLAPPPGARECREIPARQRARYPTCQSTAPREVLT